MKTCIHSGAIAIALSSLCAAAHAEPLEHGFLCCNMRTDGGWISDSNYAESGKRIIPVGSPVKFLGFGRYRVNAEIEGRRQSLGNDYSRDISMEDFAARYIVAKNPRDELPSLPKKLRTAIETMRVTKGMSKDQVISAIGYPISSENPNLDVRQWRYWLWSFSPYSVHFDEDGKVTSVTGDPDTLLKVFIE